MRSWYTYQNWSPQRLIAMLKDVQARETESWRSSLISKTSVLAPEITSKHRDAAVRWLVYLHNQFNFHFETFFLAVQILDRFLTIVKCRPRYMKCMTVSSLYIASKILEEEEDIPTTSELVENSDCGCRKQDIHRMERIMLSKLQWNLHTPTPYTFLQIFYNFTHRIWSESNDVSAPKRSRFILAHHYAVLSLDLQHVLCDYSIVPFPSSVLALAFISLDMEKHSSNCLNTIRKLQALAKVSTPDLINCRLLLLSMASQKFSNPNFNNLVSQRDYGQSSPPHAMETTMFQDQDLATTTTAAQESSPELPVTNVHSCTGLVKSCNDTVMKKLMQTGAAMPGSTVEDNDDLYDSDKTMSASEGEEEKEDFLEKPKPNPERPLSYADIVKFGVLDSSKPRETQLQKSSTQFRRVEPICCPGPCSQFPLSGDEFTDRGLIIFRKIFGFSGETEESQLMVTN